MSTQARQPVVVLKFGGTSVSTRDRWETITKIATERLKEGLKPFIVCSAVSGVSNLLEAVVEGAPRGKQNDALAEIREKHEALTEALGVDAESTWLPLFTELERIARGAALLGEASPRTHARMLSMGELMSTRMGVAFMRAQGVHAEWVDAREHLDAGSDLTASERRSFLSSACIYSDDPALQKHVTSGEPDVFVTQGFIARNSEGETVLLGRGGSDTSAAYFASKLNASRCEIWTDVPGMFTADPRIVPTARHLRFVDYDEAQEIATTGAKVLHPRCIGPCREAGIPLHIRSTPNPEIRGTVIARPEGATQPGVKAISSKKNVTLISMDTVGMWQQVGFLADAFACFKRRGLSIDQISTSETNVTVALDPTANTLTDEIIRDLLDELGEFCKATEIGPATAVSLVGSNIRSVLHLLGPALKLFQEQRIYIVTQAANDLNITFVVDNDQAVRLVKRMHDTLFAHTREGDVFGQAWDDLMGQSAPSTDVRRWWTDAREELLRIDVSDRPAYVYNREEVRAAAERLNAMSAVNRVFYAVKANTHPEILRTIRAAGCGFECVSPGEIERVMSVFADSDTAFSADEILFTPNFAPISEYAKAFELGVHVNVDNMHPVKEHPEVFRGREIFIRIDPGRGRGHHDHVRTAGRGSKFGVDFTDVDELQQICRDNDIRIVGLHAHAGSGILTSGHWRETALLLKEYAQRFPDVRVLDIGGGLGVVDRDGQRPLDLQAVNAELLAFREAWDIELWIEPGRYFVANAGVLLASVTQLKDKGDMHYVGINAGMHSLIRPALYGAYHRIVNLSRYGAANTLTANVVGPICETGDTLGHARRLPETQEGDVMLIDTAGAYGFVMASEYNLRGRPEEIVV